MQDNLHYPALPVKNWKILFKQVLLPACLHWQQLAHSDYAEDARVLLNSVSAPSLYQVTWINQV